MDDTAVYIRPREALADLVHSLYFSWKQLSRMDFLPPILSNHGVISCILCGHNYVNASFLLEHYYEGHVDKGTADSSEENEESHMQLEGKNTKNFNYNI